MEAKKDIGFVVKETLQNYSPTPDDSVWESIATDLQKDQRRRRILFYWLLGAGMLLIPILLLIGSSNVSDENPEDIFIEPIINNDQTHRTPVIPKPTKTVDSISKPALKNSPINLKNSKDDCACDSSSKTSIESREELSTQVETNLKKKRTVEHLEDVAIKDHITQLTNELTEKTFEQKKTPKKKKKKAPVVKEIKENVKPEEEWSIFPYVSLDHYNAFNLKTKNQNSINYGVYFSYYTTPKTMIRTGFKKLSLSHDFQNGGLTNTQEVSYLEIPLEIRYILDSKNSLYPSVTGGISYLFLDKASLSNTTGITTNKGDFTNNILSFNLGAGLHKNLNKHFSINTEMFFKYHLKPYTQNFDAVPYTLSFNIGVEYKF
ncbi:outer membrane beta-barrel protein [Pseudotenacibaculum haliotis]|uniref:Outer membrane beta-barrel protein n=1 Tax=Pseudotenacibaculum haliotis TaxID=1862138 RepID=A0ABW5LUE0_9FLAO